MNPAVLQPESGVFIQAEEVPSPGSTVIIGFPGSGLVGSISVAYLIDALEFKQIGYITSKFFPPMALMSNGVISVPVRIYAKDKFVAILADIPIQPEICYEIANTLVQWFTSISIQEIIVIAGIITNDTETRIFSTVTEKELLERLPKSCIPLPIGNISGIAGSILIEAKINKIPGIGLLAETINAPDPRASVSALSVLNTYFSLDIDLSALHEQAESIESQMHDLAEEVSQHNTDDMQKREVLPMYG
ncbi:MAG: proteasome assembly chaperone family protein [Methanomicrobiales archaeon]|jgi:uncharacterized protein|nr:proteasome assembly chaperone family protein [Methanomicrobiales archaeon]